MFEQNEIFDLWCEKAFSQSLCIAAYEYFYKEFWKSKEQLFGDEAYKYNYDQYMRALFASEQSRKIYDNYKLALHIRNKVNYDDSCKDKEFISIIDWFNKRTKVEFWIKKHNDYLAYKAKNGSEPNIKFFVPDFFWNMLKENDIISIMEHKPIKFDENEEFYIKYFLTNVR